MFQLMFQFGKEYILVVIKGKSIYFGNTVYGAKLATIDGLKLNKSGVIKEFPDLKDREDWNVEAVKRFKIHVSKMKSEMEISEYVIKELTKFGYVYKSRQRDGFRPERA